MKAISDQNSSRPSTYPTNRNSQPIRATTPHSPASFAAIPTAASPCQAAGRLPSEVMYPPSKAAISFLRPMAGNQTADRIVEHGGCGSVRLRGQDGFDNNPRTQSASYAISANETPTCREQDGLYHNEYVSLSECARCVCITSWLSDGSCPTRRSALDAAIFRARSFDKIAAGRAG
jgi:hypothetical protein